MSTSGPQLASRACSAGVTGRMSQHHRGQLDLLDLPKPIGELLEIERVWEVDPEVIGEVGGDDRLRASERVWQCDEPGRVVDGPADLWRAAEIDVADGVGRDDRFGKTTRHQLPHQLHGRGPG